MTDNRNTILAIILSGLVLIGWQYFFAIPQEKARQEQLASQQAAKRAATRGIMLGATIRPLLPHWSAGLGTVVMEGDAARAVRADAEALTRALGHLVRNALEASPRGTPVRVRLDEDGDEARVHVIDAGQGMSADFLRTELFRPFSSTKSNGFGLGAHEARLLVQAMGGQLDVESAPGAGTHFTIRLPFADRLGESAPDAPPMSTRRAG